MIKLSVRDVFSKVYELVTPQDALRYIKQKTTAATKRKGIF